MSLHYLYDRVTPSYDYPNIGEVVANFVAVNSNVGLPVCVYDDLEFELAGHRQSLTYRETLFDFIDNDEMPWRWGPRLWGSRVTLDEVPLLDPLMKTFQGLPVTDLMDPRLHFTRNALFWPLDHVSLKAFRILYPCRFVSFNSSRRELAEYIFEATRAPNLESGLVQLAKKVRDMALSLGLTERLVPCKDIIKSICILQFIRMLKGFQLDRERSILQGGTLIPFMIGCTEAVVRDFPGLISTWEPRLNVVDFLHVTPYDSGVSTDSEFDSDIEV
ncbi:nonstructural protein [Alcube virus]|uniref:Nonstructural protein n=1 Tax=Alcube virus TaxID=1725367 RepID=A0A0N9MPA8_9VIRU|nr:nonstructural protein [Alcube virus]ALG75835.1 nonstructural protein [Alcube virus]